MPFPQSCSSTAITCQGDGDGNGVINFADLNSVLSAFGQPCQAD